MGQWKSSLSCKTYFQKSLRSNFIIPKKLNINIFSEVARNINSSEWIVFNWLNNFLKKKTLRNIITKIVHKTFFCWCYINKIIPNSASFVLLATSYLSSNRFCSNISTNCSCTPFRQVKTENRIMENYVHIYTICRVVEFKRCYWL